MLVRYASAVTGEWILRVLDFVATAAFALALLSQAFYLGAREPSTLGIPDDWSGISRVIQFIGGLLLLLLVASPFLYVDHILAALMEARAG